MAKINAFTARIGTAPSEALRGTVPAFENSTSENGTSGNGTSVTVLVVGQLPPPVNGQSLMIRSFLEGRYTHLRLVHVPMRFSRSTAEVGSFHPRKLWLLAVTCVQIVVTRFRSGATVLYYPPAGANLVPVLRDLVLLIPTRWLFRRTAFHFHAAGLCNIYPHLPRVLRPLFHLAYDHPDLAIFTTAATSAEATQLHAKATAIVPCGIADCAPHVLAAQQGPPTILFAGILCEEKGVLTLLEACRVLQSAGVDFQVACLGAFRSEEFKQTVETFLRESGLESRIHFPGVVTGEEKDRYFANAAIFCFPSHYPAESFGVVLIEAMSFSLPIVATAWQGIPEVLGRAAGDASLSLEGSRLVPIRDPASLAEALRQVIESPPERAAMGQHNRARYLEHFTIHRYRASLEEQLASLGLEPHLDCRPQATLPLPTFGSNQKAEAVASAILLPHD